MINDLNKTLKKLLVQEVSSTSEEQIHFEAPDDSFAPALPAVNLFLYDVRENWELRSNEWQIERGTDIVTRHPPPARVDCSYLITAWAGDIDSEHRLLGEIMRVLLRHRQLPAEMLQGEVESSPSSSRVRSPLSA